jgi:RNA polymerase primary sigma factor
MTKKYVNFDNENSLSKYFKDVRKSILLTPDEEVVLAKKIQSGDESAIEELVNANLKFVISIAKEYQNQGLALSDLISEGNYGLIKAATRFDHSRGFRFISYAVWWIKQSIIQSLNENARMVRLPANIINRLSGLKKEIEKFEFENEREPIFGEILDENSQAVELTTYPKCSSLNDLINEDGDELIDLVSDPSEDINNVVVDERIKNEIRKTLSILDERERNIIQSYYGIDTGCEPMTLEAIGEKYYLTKERIRQIKEKSLRKLRHNAHNLYNLIKE